MQLLHTVPGPGCMRTTCESVCMHTCAQPFHTAPGSTARLLV